MLPALFLGSLALTLAVASLLWQAAPGRRDNRLGALICVNDAVGIAALQASFLDGLPLLEGSPAVPLSLVNNYLFLGFVYALPQGQVPPRWLRILYALLSSAGILLWLLPATQGWFMAQGRYFFSALPRLILLGLIFRSYRRLGPGLNGPRLVFVAIFLRFATTMLTYSLMRLASPEVFRASVVVQLSLMPLLCYLLVGYSMLRFHLFGVRALLPGLLLRGGLIFAALSSLWITMGLILGREVSEATRRAQLMAVGLSPFAFYAAWRGLLPRLEDAIAAPLNPRGALRKATTRRALAEAEELLHPAPLVARLCAAIGELSAPGAVSFLRGPAWVAKEEGERLPGALEAHLATREEGFLLRRFSQGLSPELLAELSLLKSDLLVPVRRAGRLFGAFSLQGGAIDRETLSCALELAEQLALRLDHYALFLRATRLEEELKAAQQLAALGSFAAGIAHDIRTPLTSIKMNVQILRGKAKLAPSEMEYFEIALEELDRLNENVGQLLSYAKPAKLRRAPLDLPELLEETARGVAPLLGEKGLRLELQLEPHLPAAQGDAQQLRRVLTNLLTNAAHASPKGALLTLRAQPAEGRVAVELVDHGRGIAPENLPKIFEPFFTTRPDGTGLGLAIAKKIISAHGGEISARPTPGGGTTMTILLPAEGASPASAPPY